jgi:hypothetical protein
MICRAHLYHRQERPAARSFHRALRVALIVRSGIPAQLDGIVGDAIAHNPGHDAHTLLAQEEALGGGWWNTAPGAAGAETSNDR